MPKPKRGKQQPGSSQLWVRRFSLLGLFRYEHVQITANDVTGHAEFMDVVRAITPQGNKAIASSELVTPRRNIILKTLGWTATAIGAPILVALILKLLGWL